MIKISFWEDHLRGFTMGIDSTQIFNAVPDSIRIIGKDKKLRWVNKQFERLIAKDMTELKGKKCYEHLCISKTLGEKGCYLNKMIKKEPISQKEITIKNSEGKILTFMATYTPYRDEKKGLWGLLSI